jgi:hypothetical protein
MNPRFVDFVSFYCTFTEQLQLTALFIKDPAYYNNETAI